MAIANILDRVTQWVQDTVCPQIELKVPPAEENEATDADYLYQRVHPTAFTLYVPSKDKLPPPVISPFPSICVRATDGADDLGAWRGGVNLQLVFSAWSPGVYGGDILLPNQEVPLKPKIWNLPEAVEYFRRSSDGWRDAWNMADIAIREIESITHIDGLVIDRSVPVKFGPLTEQEAIPDYYPFWFAWVSFALQYPLSRNVEDLSIYL